MNSVSFNELKFGNETLNYYSEFKNVQFDQNKPNFIHSEIQLASVQDQYSIIQLGQTTEHEFYFWGMTPIQPSAWTIFPSKYKFTGIEIMMSFDTIQYSRQTYGLLQLMSDIGGLGQALMFVASTFFSWFAQMNAGLFLMRNLFVSTSTKFLSRRNTFPSSG
jgi:hypothetical protein